MANNAILESKLRIFCILDKIILNQIQSTSERVTKFSDFETRVDPVFGNCFTFNYNRTVNLTSIRAGPMYGKMPNIEMMIQ